MSVIRTTAHLRTARLSALRFIQYSSREMVYGDVTQLPGTWTHLPANIRRMLQDGKAANASGNATQFQLVADYGLSSRTSVYFEAE
jgi:hypothetical protein